jgi:hypothetical protein
MMNMKTLFAALSAVVLLAGCSESAPELAVPSVTLAPPTPAGMREAPPEPVQLPITEDDCSASLRPFPHQGRRGRGRREHPQPGQAHRRPRHRQQSVQLP